MREDDIKVGELREACARRDWLAACEALAGIAHPELREALALGLPAGLRVAASLVDAGEEDGARWLDVLEGAEWAEESVEVFEELLEARRVGGVTLRWRGELDELVSVALDGVMWADLRQARWRLGREWHRVLPDPFSEPLIHTTIELTFLRTYLEQVREFVDAQDGEWEELELEETGPLDARRLDFLVPTADGEVLWVARHP